jgi:GGDEF domain-containing protein
VEVAQAVRAVIRNVDLVALLDAHTLAVLLPDVDAAGAAVVVQRVGGAVAALQAGAAVAAVTREAGESDAAFLARALRHP